ncbi:sulfatase-like hydrolase/transferase [Alistipes timonensis]|uniref:sulfatase-like hydrolase/transferase n=1 Tax=Alistipes timonensis TaxID=1465754 RepID=UPI00189B9E1D|nr:sulfatase-like hydrolase/transferase [Alistipes timonensis]
MKTTGLLGITVLAAATSPGSAAIARERKAPERRPNILCLVCEDISPYLGCYGDKLADTPNLDRFAREGIRYTRMFTTIGVSAPSRASLITGLFPTSFGANYMRTSNTKPLTEGLVPPYEAVPDDGVKCYTEFLRAAGYYCTNNVKTDYQFKPPVTAWDESSKTAHWKNRPEGMPFFAIFNMTVTHESQVWKRADEPLILSPDEVVLPPYHPDNAVTRRDWAVMYSNVHEMDRQMQSYIDEVRDAGLLDNTIVIWYSDNGGPLPRQKRELYESGALVPFMVRFPDGTCAGTVEDRLLMFADIPATILSLAGIRPPSYMHGIPFLGRYEGRERSYVYGARDRLDEIVERQTCVRDARYRYVCNHLPGKSGYMQVLSRLNMPMMRNMVELYERGELDEQSRRWFEKPRRTEEFYDVDNDPHEMHNLIDDPRYARDIARMRRELTRWDNRYNPYLGLTEAELRERLWPGGVQPGVAAPEVRSDRNGSVKIVCATKGASIAYQIDGRGYSEKHWLLYTAPVRLQPGQTLTAVATRIGCKTSDVTTYKH